MRVYYYVACTLAAGLLALNQNLETLWLSLDRLSLDRLDLDQIGLSLFVMMLHAPSLFQLRVVRRFSGIKLGRYPELPFLAFIFLSWLAVGVFTGSIVYAINTGVVFTVIVGLSYGASRMIDFISKAATLIASNNPYFLTNSLTKKSKQLVFVFRAGTASLSVIAIMMLLFSGVSTYWWLPQVVVGLVLTALAVAVIGPNLKATAKRAASSGATAIAASVVKNPPKCVIYYSSSKTSNHKLLAPTVKKFAKAAIPTGLISREPHSLAACRAAKPNYLWCASSIAHLDAFFQPSIKAAIYLNDAGRNAHFIRFNGLAHILFAQSGPVSKLKRLTNNMNAYDAIVAPNEKIAALWRQNSETEIASRIVIVDGKAVAFPIKTSRTELSSRLSLSLSPGAIEMQDVYECTKAIRAILYWVSQNESRHLSVSIRGAKSDAPTSLLNNVLKRAVKEGQRVEVRKEAVVHAESDILIATSADDLWSFAQSQKPVLMLGSQSNSDDVKTLWGDKEEILLRLSAASEGNYAIPLNAFRRWRYQSLGALIDAMSNAKTLEELKS